MTNRAVLRKPGGKVIWISRVDKVTLMAGITICACTCELVAGVTLHTSHIQMVASEGKFGQAVIEFRSLPGRRRVAGIALRGKVCLAMIRVFCLLKIASMTAEAVLWCSGIAASNMAGGAIGI